MASVANCNDLITDDRCNSLTISVCPCCASDPCSCPRGFCRCGGHCLKRLKQTMNYADTEAACEKLGAHLAVPCSEAENQCALDLAGTTRLWLGVTDRDIEGTFVGVEGTCSPAPASENWWISREPNGKRHENCLAIKADGWFDDVCWEAGEMYPLCQLRDHHQPECQ